MMIKHKTGLIAAMMVFLMSGVGFSEKSANDDFSLEPLRDPFWPVGYTPENWKAASSEGNNASATSGADWTAPSKQISVTGTSRMGDKAVAIVNGELKGVGDLIEVSYGGRIYQWKLKKITAAGTVDIERVGVKNAGGRFNLGDKK